MTAARTERPPVPGASLDEPFDWRATIRELEYVVGALDTRLASNDAPHPADVNGLVAIGQALLARLIRHGPAEEETPC